MVSRRFREELCFVCFRWNLGCDFGRAYIPSKKPCNFWFQKSFLQDLWFVYFRCNLGWHFGRACIASKKPWNFVYGFKEVSRGGVFRMFEVKPTVRLRTSLYSFKEAMKLCIWFQKSFREDLCFVCFRWNLGCDFGRAYIASKKPWNVVYGFKEFSLGLVFRMFWEKIRARGHFFIQRLPTRAFIVF